MLRRLLYIPIVLVVALSSCIENNLPYPAIHANFMSLEAQGQEGATIIDTVAMTATINFPEQVDLSAVKIMGYSLSPGAEIVDNPFTEPVDLTSPLFVYLKLYQNWLWKIVAKQEIERYFDVSGQLGETVIDVPAKRVVLYVNASADVSALPVTRAKLGPTGSAMTPDLSDGGTFDARTPFVIKIDNHGKSEQWTIYVEAVAETVRTESVDAWTRVAWVNCMAEAGLDNGVEYCVAGTNDWQRVPAGDITSSGGLFTACIKHLQPETSYQARAYSGDEYANVIEFATGAEVQLPNSNFDNWWLDKKVWCPWEENGTAYWGTGNQGAATMGQSNTIPSDDTPSGSGFAACLQTRFVGIGTLGKLAAGNIFTGDYVRTVGTNGVLSFGREFTQRPVRLKGQFKYTTAPINYASDEFAHMKGQPDTCIVWLALIDSPEPFEIRTDPKDRNLFNPDGSYVVAYGKMECAKMVDKYEPFEFTLDYKSTSRVPRYIIITASASKYGDYFTGGAGATLYLDDFELLYDY
ncbi:MAG: PCMD domain-containing protein [Muribaculaceae bacterium]|nr:PCMD domain-containing protein [Muribaculaceae bacterium]